ncbi:lytic murein transglycosylase [Jiella sp. MQZ9-1]|uniref:Lytic murein transglycosylase n=1 Tax=Jiella flava TaxID=2816857 RepID=A0A939FW30_9HYPH|nr:lytic murein transglycosylase [Jiella flava]MBO0661123.1 lytic murein transglycosylase [Jiella flava]MCD2469769.1 lytic murein transglycosylase [Jiella flava]
MIDHLLRRLCRLIIAALMLAAGSARAASLDQDFRAFLNAEIWPEAKSEGVPRAIFDKAFRGVEPNTELPDLILPGGKTTVAEINFQAEFKSGAAYLSERAVAANAATGRQMLARYRGVLSRIEARYGVPAPIILAIWGRESAFGRAKIPMNAFEVLGTKAFLSRRKAMFRAELLAALKIVAEGHLKVSEMKSSWAGALGQPQFMPTKFLKYAVDFDGDGRRDIWTSVPDTLASIANYLKAEGWQRGRDWGFEAVIPRSVSCRDEGPDHDFRIADLVKAGVRSVAGRRFPASEESKLGHLLFPAGRLGPTFVATPNFYVIKAYNNSDLYAVFVGQVADRVQGAGPLVGRWQKTDRMTRGDVYRLQKKLVAMGYDVGAVDGLAGFKTRRSIGVAEKKLGLPETCWPSNALAERL